MVLKLRLDFSWISFCPKIVADQDWKMSHLWNIISEPLNHFFFKFQIKILISKISKNSKKFQDVKITKKWLLKLSFLVLISVKKRQVKSHLRRRPDFNIGLIHFHYHRVPKSSRKWPFLTRNLKNSKFAEISRLFHEFSGMKMLWYQENVAIWPDFLMKLKLGEISKMLA